MITIDKQKHHNIRRKTSTAGHRPPPNVAILTGPASNGSQQLSTGYWPTQWEAFQRIVFRVAVATPELFGSIVHPFCEQCAQCDQKFTFKFKFKMKILCLVTLLVCALAQCANVDYEDLPLVEDAANHFEDLHLGLDLLSADYAVTEGDKLLISELQTLEAQGRNAVTDAISEMIENLRDVVINGNDDVPPLDPLDIPLIGPFEYQAPATTATVSINDFKMEGLRWYVLDSITFNALRLSFGAHITIPWITVTGSYDARARLGLLTHRAGGSFRIFAHRIEVGMDMRMGTNLLGGHLILRELNINIDIHDTLIQFHGMTGSNIINAFINNYVQNLTQELIQAEMENVSRMLSEELFDVVNDVLKDYTINDILGL